MTGLFRPLPNCKQPSLRETSKSSFKSQWDSKKNAAMCLRLQKHFCDSHFFLSSREYLCLNGILILETDHTYLALLLVISLKFCFSKCVFSPKGDTMSQCCYMLVILDKAMNDVPAAWLRVTLVNSQLLLKSKKLRFKRNYSNF